MMEMFCAVLITNFCVHASDRLNESSLISICNLAVGTDLVPFIISLQRYRSGSQRVNPQGEIPTIQQTQSGDVCYWSRTKTRKQQQYNISLEVGKLQIIWSNCHPLPTYFIPFADRHVKKTFSIFTKGPQGTGNSPFGHMTHIMMGG